MLHKYGSALDHQVCVQSDEKRIYGSAESYPFPLTEVKLAQCGGPDYPNASI